MPLTPYQTYGNKIVQTLYPDPELLEVPVALKPSTVYPAGAVLGELLGVVDVQHFHVVSALTSGGYTASDGVNTSPTIAFNAAAADVQAAFNAAQPAPILYNVAGGPLSGGAPADFVLTRQAAGVQATFTFPTNTTAGGALSVTHPTVGTAPSNGTYALYASGNSDGSQLARGILRYPCSTDANGNILGLGDNNVSTLTIPLAFAGSFRIQDLAFPGNPGGLDANAVTVLGARIIEGAVGSSGVIILPA
jgi:hypothetical protein